MINLERPLTFIIYNPSFHTKKAVLFGYKEMMFKTHFGSDSLVRILFHGTDIQEYQELIKTVSNKFEKITISSRNREQVLQLLAWHWLDAKKSKAVTPIIPKAFSNDNIEWTSKLPFASIVNQDTYIELDILPRTEVRISFE